MSDAYFIVQDKAVMRSKFRGNIHAIVQTGSGIGCNSLTSYGSDK